MKNEVDVSRHFGSDGTKYHYATKHNMQFFLFHSRIIQQFILQKYCKTTILFTGIRKQEEASGEGKDSSRSQALISVEEDQDVVAPDYGQKNE